MSDFIEVLSRSVRSASLANNGLVTHGRLSPPGFARQAARSPQLRGPRGFLSDSVRATGVRLGARDRDGSARSRALIGGRC